MATRTTLPGVYAERTSTKLRGQILEDDGVTGFLPSTLTLTLFSEEDGSIINSVNGTNIHNTDRGTIDAEGRFEINLTPDDMPIVTPRQWKSTEVHVAQLSWTWSGGRKGHFEIAFAVGDLLKVGA